MEFGSDFHRCEENFAGKNGFIDKIKNIRYYASGRFSIEAILKKELYKRIWIPSYFCYEVVEHIENLNVKVIFYDDNPLSLNDDFVLSRLPYEDGDVLLRVNYFGLRARRSNRNIKVPVIEDHSHDILSDWSLHSDADWCIASIRKLFPVAAGGILWSPKGMILPDQIEPSMQCLEMSDMRYNAMSLKSEYLKKGGDKSFFRKKYLDSESMIDRLDISGMDYQSEKIFKGLDVSLWTEQKNTNWRLAKNILGKVCNILDTKEDIKYNPFSLIILSESEKDRDKLRQYMIANAIYPAILWNVPESTDFKDSLNLSKRILSLHCDGRYSFDEISSMCSIIKTYYGSNI